MNKIKALRLMLIQILDDEDGILSDGYDALRGYIALTPEHEDACQDIFSLVESTCGKNYLPENHGLTE